jgi:hypothetical protein
MWRVDSGLLTWDLAQGEPEPICAGFYTCDAAPRAMLRRHLITVQLTPSDVHRLVKCLEAEAEEAIAEGKSDYADWLLYHAAEIREAAR